MPQDRIEGWIEHPELVGKVVRSIKRTDEAPRGDSHIVIDFEDGTSLALGANDLGTWVETSNYPATQAPAHALREAAPDYSAVKALAEQLAQSEQLRLAHELLVLANTPVEVVQPKRYARDFVGIWQGVTFDEEDFKAVEWYLPRDESD